MLHDSDDRLRDVGNCNPQTRSPSGTIKPLCVRVMQAANMLGISRSRIYEHIDSGDIEVVKLGRSTLIPVESLEALVENLREQNRL